MHSRLYRALGGLTLLALTVTAIGTPAAAQAAPAATAGIATSAVPSGWTPRPEQYPNTVTQVGLAIPMDDGVTLRGDLTLPADADRNAIPGRFPVVVTITAYNKGVQQYAGGLAGGDPSYLVKRGYAQLTVDARGTGTSEGVWCMFCTREDKDAGEVLQWAHEQSWSNGRTAMSGPSYMGISQFFAAAGKPDGLSALFPQVPGADTYRDITASGGQLDVGFMPLWLGLVWFTGLIPPATAPDDPSPLAVLAQHLLFGGANELQLLLEATAGGEPAYDGPFYRQRSPINVVDRVDVPTFLIGGEYDLFQRGTPLLFENLDRRGVPAKMIIGPWDHLQGSAGDVVADAGYGTLDELKLRWFDHYVRDVPDPALDSDIPPFTYYELGTGDWRTEQHWMGPDRAAVSYRLSGSSSTGGSAGTLTTGPAQAGTADVLPIPVQGLCTRSTSQWTAGTLNTVPLPNPCNTDNQWNDRLGVVYSSAPATRPLAFQGPINVRLYVSSTSGDGMLAVALEDEAPDGTVSRLTGGWQVISLRALDAGRSRYLDGQLVQPYHPFTQESKAKLAAGQVAPVDVEVFPTGARILPGHRLRIAVQAFDVPHLIPTLTDLVSTLTVIRIHNSAAYPSRVTLPALSPAPSRTSAGLRLARARAGAVNRARIAVRVPGYGDAASGRVGIWVDGHRVATRTLREGRATFRVPARTSRTPGRHRLWIRYLGAELIRPSATTVRWRVHR